MNKIKTEASSNDDVSMACSFSPIQVKKEEEDDDDVDDGDDVTTSTSTSTSRSRRRGLRVQVKKEEERKDDAEDDENNNPVTDMNCKNKNEINETLTCDNYDDWKCGNWCWLLPAATGNDSKKRAARSRNTPHRENGTTSDDDDDVGDDDETQLLPPKKKTRSSTHHPSSNNRNNNIVVERQEEKEETICHGEGAKNIDGAVGNVDVDIDEGYESWTEGNWCWILHTSRTNAEQDPSSDEEISNTETYTSNGSPVRRDHDSISSSFLEEDDDDEDGEDASVTYKNRQNEWWNEMFGRLVLYKKQYNSTNVPSRYGVDRKLGNWVRWQRHSYMAEIISESRISRLESIGFVWNTLDNQWDEMFQRPVMYQQQHGSTLVPKRYEADPKLGQWVIHQRERYRNNNNKRFSIERIKRLESIGFVWDHYDLKWTEMYDRFVAYKKKHKSRQEPYNYTEENQLPPLRKWASVQRTFYRDGKLLKKRMECLNSINFEWETKK
jgi:hypothetical protein